MVAKLVQTSASELSPDRGASVPAAEALQEDDGTRSASSSAASRQDMGAEQPLRRSQKANVYTDEG